MRSLSKVGFGSLGCLCLICLIESEMSDTATGDMFLITLIAMVLFQAIPRGSAVTPMVLKGSLTFRIRHVLARVAEEVKLSGLRRRYIVQLKRAEPVVLVIMDLLMARMMSRTSSEDTCRV